MSIWSDMQDRSAGISLSKEDYNLLYGGEVLNQIYKDTYKDMRYEIIARKFPCIEIISKLDISIFSGSRQVILCDEKKTIIFFMGVESSSRYIRILIKI